MSPGVALVVVLLLIAANGLFVAAEFGLVAVSRGALEERAEAGDRPAQLALELTHHLTFVLSAAQFGITATSLLVGFLAEDAIGGLLVAPVVSRLGITAGTTRAISVTAAFLISSVVQMLLGELAPKNVAIARPELTAVRVARPMRWFSMWFRPVIRVFDVLAAWITRIVLRAEVHEELLGGHSLDDLSRIIEASGAEGSLSREQAELLLRAVDLRDRRISEVMVPRPDVVWIDHDATLDDLRGQARTTGHSRFPVRGDDEDDVVGTVHVKDLLGIPPERRPVVPVAAVSSPALVVPESDRAQRLLAQLRRQHRTFAVAVDEYGGTAGIVTLEDLLEQLVGDIEDEFDRDMVRIRRLSPDRFVVQGNLRADRVGDLVGVEVPEGDYETVAGFVIQRLGHIPSAGEQLEHDGWEFRVTAVEGVRVATIELHRLPTAHAEPGRGDAP